MTPSVSNTLQSRGVLQQDSCIAGNSRGFQRVLRGLQHAAKGPKNARNSAPARNGAEQTPAAGEAIQHADASHQGRAVLIDGKHQVISEADADRLAAAGVEFAYLVDHEMPDGERRILTIPVN